MKLETAIKSNRFSSYQEKAAINVLFTGYWLRSSYSAALKSEGISLEQFNVMRILKGKYPEQMCVKDIGSRIIEKSSNVPRIIDRLVEKELASRTTSKIDKRETLITLTEKGLTLLVRANEIIARINNSIGLDDEESKTLNSLLEKMRDVPNL